ncbi:MAG: hypothetical protein LKI67_02015 [Olsenella sp.]|jgi:4-carboxymuconolactone decarboxylase|nr:hypothetical protein [Olsenella sp.]MCI1810613.1 hypothetical protein [Olsenella sp.]MCI1879304.1 hypothetical protein [Olsenella sp.]
MNEILETQGVELPLEGQATTEPTRESRMEGGEQAQIEVFGEGIRGYSEKGNPDYPHFNEWFVEN